MRRLVAISTLAALLCGGCDFPADPDGTLERVRGGVMRVGVTPAEPFVRLDDGGDPTGVEVELVQGFAETLDARVEWVTGSESDLMEALAGGQLDVVIAGLTRQSEWQRTAALTRPYLTTQVVIAAPDEALAEQLSEDLEGVPIGVEANSPEAAKLEQDTDAIVVPVDDLAAIVIGLDIAHDGVCYSGAAVKDLLDGRPRKYDEKAVHELVGEVRDSVAGLDWIDHAAVRMRELGHVLAVEVLAVPRDTDNLRDRVEDAVERIRALDWKLQDVVVSVVREIDGAPDDVLVDGPAVPVA